MPAPSPAVHAWIARNKNSAIRFLQDVVRIDTVNPPGHNYKPMVERLQQKLRALGFSTRLIRVPARANPNPAFPRYNLIGRWDTGARRTIHFNAHYDVVPVADGWRFGPFNPKGGQAN